MTDRDIHPQSSQAIGVRLRETRDALGLTSREMAARCDILEKNLSAYMSGQNLLKPDVAVKIINAFPSERIDFNWLYKGDMAGLSHGLATRIIALRNVDPPAKSA